MSSDVYENDFYRPDVPLPPDFVSPQQDSALIWMDDEIGVYDFETGEEIPLISPGDNAIPFARYTEDGTDTIDVFVSNDEIILAYWRVSVEFDRP